MQVDIAMQWGSVSEFFAMGGYGLYVWGSYVVAAVALVVEVIVVIHRARTSVAVVSPTAAGRTNR